MSDQALIAERDGAVLRLTLNRPEALNAINFLMLDELNEVFERLYWDRETRVVVLGGAGRGFCAGIDIKQQPDEGHPLVMNGTVSDGLYMQRRLSEIAVKMRRCPQPIIAKVHGVACGAGFALMLASDIRLGSLSARMNCAFVRIGLGGAL